MELCSGFADYLVYLLAHFGAQRIALFGIAQSHHKTHTAFKAAELSDCVIVKPADDAASKPLGGSLGRDIGRKDPDVDRAVIKPLRLCSERCGRTI